MKEDNIIVWVNQKMLYIVSFFARKDGLDHAYTEAGPSSNLGVLSHEGNKMVCNKYEGCVILLHEYLFSLIGLCLPFNAFEVDILNQLRISPLATVSSELRDCQNLPIFSLVQEKCTKLDVISHLFNT